jgi:hypothetical protein
MPPDRADVDSGRSAFIEPGAASAVHSEKSP